MEGMYIEGIGEWIGIGALIGLYVGIKVWIYRREYGTKGNKGKVFKRGSEWD